jgi:hypothetical protein
MMSASITDDINPMTLAESLTVKEIITAAGVGAFTYREHWRRDLLIAAVQDSAVLQATIKDAYFRKQDRACNDRNNHLKCAWFHDPSEEQEASMLTSRNDSYLLSPSDDAKSDCLARLIDRTSNAGTRQVVCIVCALEVFAVGTEEFAVDDIPESHLLIPLPCHPRQHLTNGILLHYPALTLHDGHLCGRICCECLQELRARKLPKLVLANGLWIGEVPQELAILTLPERVLIGLYFPVSFIMKLFPQKKGSRNWDTSALNSGVRGNVSTYRLNTEDIAAMIEGHLLPRTPDLLPAIIGITIIGPNNLPARNLPRFLTVSRERVKQALIFLKRENPLYSDISISDLHLDLLPSDVDVPSQLLSVVKHSSDTNMLDQEHEGYVVEDDDDEIDSGDGQLHYCLSASFSLQLVVNGGAFQTHAVMQRGRRCRLLPCSDLFGPIIIR